MSTIKGFQTSKLAARGLKRIWSQAGASPPYIAPDPETIVPSLLAESVVWPALATVFHMVVNGRPFGSPDLILHLKFDLSCPSSLQKHNCGSRPKNKKIGEDNSLPGYINPPSFLICHIDTSFALIMGQPKDLLSRQQYINYDQRNIHIWSSLNPPRMQSSSRRIIAGVLIPSCF